VGEVVEFVGDFDFLREGEGAKRVAMVLIWKGFLYLSDFSVDCWERDFPC
jgi:hypothetical protein